MKNFKAGQYQNQGSYKSFQPNFINRQWFLEDMDIIMLLSKASMELGKLDMYSEHVPDIDLFISMHVRKEASQSSKIEGTQTNIEDVILDVEDVSADKKDDWEEVHNYIDAMNESIEQLKTLPFSIRLIKQAHKRLLQGVRGKNKLPGEFRSSQNWIGGVSINDAVFVPPIQATVQELMGDLEKFVHNEEFQFPELLKIALVHYQFETIHPFLDGNGRVGRLLIVLYLVEKKMLKNPILYLSDFFERNRQLYYDNLMNVRTKNDIKQWFKFFLTGIIETAQNGVKTFDAVLKLKQDTEIKIQTNHARSGHLLKIMEYLYKEPIIKPHTVVEITKVSIPTAYTLLDEMEKMGILKGVKMAKTGKKGNIGKMYVFQEYIKLF
jgi:Fic family protein